MKIEFAKGMMILTTESVLEKVYVEKELGLTDGAAVLFVKRVLGVNDDDSTCVLKIEAQKGAEA